MLFLVESSGSSLILTLYPKQFLNKNRYVTLELGHAMDIT